eukprot:augustus_masked-scaffold_2-processed-gene-3.41-mRNA-1 protein AED:0.36 eAED:0.37 QI:0/-1/0/1/-1/1/1/0/493
MDMPEWMLSTLNNIRITIPTEVQKHCLPVGLYSSSNILASAPTGSGKSACFLLPLLMDLKEDPFGVHSLILTPTRELAYQIYEQTIVLGSGFVKSCVVVGGVSMLKQKLLLEKRHHVVIGTPGRVLSHLQAPDALDCFFIKKLRFFVLDEVDCLLSCDHSSELRKTVYEIFDFLPKREDLRFFMYSATINSESTLEELNLATKLLSPQKDWFKYFPSSQKVKNLDEKYIKMPQQLKLLHLCNALRWFADEDLIENTKLKVSSFKEKKIRNAFSRKLADEIQDASGFVSEEVMQTIWKKRAQQVIVFIKKKSTCEVVLKTLSALGFIKKGQEHAVVALHSNMSQMDRFEAIDYFKSGRAKVLLATDLAARGLDIPKVDLVINYDLHRKGSPEVYIHRAGRTARAGRVGKVLSFVGKKSSDILALKEVEEKMYEKKYKIEKLDLYELTESVAMPLLTKVTNSREISKLVLEKDNNDIDKSDRFYLNKRRKITKSS